MESTIESLQGLDKALEDLIRTLKELVTDEV
ncbi:hypothetical protein SEA_MINIFLAYER_15 [Satellite phage MiniFlayer]|nr:hypothetical protein SEA_MINIFLAYER_15 [Satellite phage MiniFlayer]